MILTRINNPQQRKLSFPFPPRTFPDLSYLQSKGSSRFLLLLFLFESQKQREAMWECNPVCWFVPEGLQWVELVLGLQWVELVLG